MTYGVVVDVAAPAEMYDALQHEVVRSMEGGVEGLLLHVGRATSNGFQVIEVWTDKDRYDRYNEDVVFPAAARLGEGQSGPPPETRTEEFEVRGLVLPAAELVR
jgi:quinol monooxygenase YgiN